MDSTPFTQRFFGALLVAVVAGLIVHLATESSGLSVLEPVFDLSRSDRPGSSGSIYPPTESADGNGEFLGKPEADSGVPGAEWATPGIDRSLKSVDLSGRWVGKWTTPDGWLFTFSMDLQQSEQTVVNGAIRWKLKISPRMDFQKLVGLSGTEFVRGSLNPTSGSLLLRGYKEKDPEGVIGLDRYNLALSDNGEEIRGTSYNKGSWTGQFAAWRPDEP